MKTVSLRKGARVKYLGKLCRVVKTHSGTEVVVENLETKQQEIAPIEFIKAEDEDTPSKPPKALETLSKKDRKEAERRRKIIDPILRVSRGRTVLYKKIAGECGVSVSTLRRWVKNFEGRRLLSDLAPKRKGRKMPDRLSQKKEKLLQKVLNEYDLTKQRLKVTHVYHQLERLCRAAGVKPPCISTLRRRIKRLPARLRTKKRHGEQAARHRHDQIKGNFPNPGYPLALVQIDHTPLDLVIVDEKDRLPIGQRVWLTLAIDVFSRMVTGLHLSLDAPSALSVGMCLVHSIQEKHIDLAKHNIETDWPVWGIMDTIHADNGADFRSDTIADSCAQYGINIEWRPPAKPEYGGYIERFLGTVNSEIHALPGTTFSNPQKRGKYNSVNEAELSFKDVECILYNFIVQVYHNRPHRDLGMTPREKWEQGIKKVGHRDRITDAQRLYRDFLPGTTRKLQREGITWDGIWYRGEGLEEEISALKYGHSKEFTVRRDPRNISKIYFFNPKLNDYSVINWTAHGEPPMSIWELRAAKRLVKEQGLGLRGQEAAFVGRKAMHDRTQKAHKTTKSTRKENAKRAVREDGLKKMEVSSTPPPIDKPQVPMEGQLRIVPPDHSALQDDEDEVFTYTDEELKPNWRRWE